jgi:histidinol phosphatase-like enzyme
MAEDLEIKQREHLKLLQETRDNADVLMMIGEGGQRNTESSEAFKQMKERIHLLTEENHILFEQVTLLRVHHDAVTKECAEKMVEATAKIQRYDNVKIDLDQTQIERDELIRANAFLETKLTEVT